MRARSACTKFFLCVSLGSNRMDRPCHVVMLSMGFSPHGYVWWIQTIQKMLVSACQINSGAQIGRIRLRTLSDLQLSACVSQRGKQVQFDASLGAQIALQMLSLLLHGGQSGQQHVRVFLHAVVLPQSLSPENTSDSENQRETLRRINIRGRKVHWFPEHLCVITFIKSTSCFSWWTRVSFTYLGNQCDAGKTLTTHWWWPYKKHMKAEIHRKMILSVWRLGMFYSSLTSVPLLLTWKQAQWFY